MKVELTKVDETLIWQHYCGSVSVRPAARGAMWCPRCGTAGQQWWRAVYTSKPGLVRQARRSRWRAVARRVWSMVEPVLWCMVILLGCALWIWFFLLIYSVIAAYVA